MATLLFSALGAVFAGRIGGVIGALVGQQISRSLFGGSSREGPRLAELAVTTSSYGTALPRVFGRMRMPGTIIWATDLVEHKDKQGGGKGKPSVVNYTYSASFAVALASRPIGSVGRIWADGNLLRGAAGDMKVGGTIRVHLGSDDQAPDPLLAAAEGSGRCPAFRGIAYIVFEDLQLADFGNRIPALTFEVLADQAPLTLSQVVDGVIDNVSAEASFVGVQGLSCDGAIGDLLATLDPAFPIDCDVSGDRLILAREATAPTVQLHEPAISAADDAFGAEQGFTRKRFPAPSAHPEILRYYDVDRDYQPGLQRAPGRPGIGQPVSTELPVAMSAGDARQLAQTIARRASWSRQTLAWRTAELDPAVRPGSLVTVPAQAGVWRVTDWEWRGNGIELSLSRSYSVATAGTSPADSGSFTPPIDAPLGQTTLHAFELPWDGSGLGETPLTYAATSSDSAGWSGAALFVDKGGGQLEPLGPSGRARAISGHATDVLPAASQQVFDRASQVTVQLAASDMHLLGASPETLATGSNRALLGSEIIQFLRAAPLGSGLWRLSGLLRGRGGTEAAISTHAIDEPFVLLDGTATALNAALIGDTPGAIIAAIGLGDSAPVTSQIACRGISRKPLAPVHARCRRQTDGSLILRWTRRARGAWTWLDGVDTPLHEQVEAYDVTLGAIESPAARWSTDAPELILPAALVTELQTSAPGQTFMVRQRGSYALSAPLLLFQLT